MVSVSEIISMLNRGSLVEGKHDTTTYVLDYNLPQNKYVVAIRVADKTNSVAIYDRKQLTKYLKTVSSNINWQEINQTNAHVV